MFSLLDKQVSISRLQNFIQWQKFATTYQALLLALCGAKQLRWQSQHLQHCISLDSHVRPLPCLAWAKCLPSRRGGRSVPCSRRQAPKINENIDGLQRFIDCAHVCCLWQEQCQSISRTFSVTSWQRSRVWFPSGRISGSTIGTIPCCKINSTFKCNSRNA